MCAGQLADCAVDAASALADVRVLLKKTANEGWDVPEALDNGIGEAVLSSRVEEAMFAVPWGRRGERHRQSMDRGERTRKVTSASGEQLIREAVVGEGPRVVVESVVQPCLKQRFRRGHAAVSEDVEPVEQEVGFIVARGSLLHGGVLNVGCEEDKGDVKPPP